MVVVRVGPGLVTATEGNDCSTAEDVASGPALRMVNRWLEGRQTDATTHEVVRM